MSENSFGARADLEVGGRSYEIYRLDALQEKFDVARLPFSLKILLENLLRNEDGVAVRKEDIEALATWDHNAEPSKEIAFTPARVVMQDFTGVPAVVDLAAMRDAMADLGGDPAKINPLVPAELVIDHSVQVDSFGIARLVPDQRRARVRAQRGALRLPALGPDGVRGLRRRPAGRRHRPPGQPRVPRPRGVRERGRAVPGHAGRDRLAHDDDQRRRRARLGRRRHRGRGRDARPGDVDADPARRRLQARRPAARGRDRHRPRAHGHPAAARARRRRQVRRVLRPGHPEPAAGRPRDDRQHEPGVRLDLRDLPDRRRDAALPRVHGALQGAHRDRRGLRQGPGPVARRRHRGEDLLGDARARPRRGRALAGRPEAPAGPRLADRGQVGVPRRARGHPARPRARAGEEPRHRCRRGGRRVLPGVRPARPQRQRLRARQLARRRGRHARAGRRARLARRPADDGRRHARPSSTTATW